jgi:hypothetical protein
MGRARSCKVWEMGLDSIIQQKIETFKVGSTEIMVDGLHIPI